jgi:hypothetical protein
MACARLHVLMPRLNREAFSLSKRVDVEALCRETQSASTLLLCADSQVSNSALDHDVLSSEGSALAA